MTTEYTIKKCKSFGFVKDIENFMNKVFYAENEEIYILSSRLTMEMLSNIEKEINHEEKTDKIHIISLDNIKEITSVNNLLLLIDFNSDIFDDIHISFPKVKKDEKSSEQQITGKDIQEQLSGQATQLDAFSNNLFTVIYGKKSANIHACNNKQNHDVLDSLARNGVVCTPKTPNILSLQIVIDYLAKCNSFRVFGMHNGFDGVFIEHEYPSEISHPSYTIGKGEILAIFYRYILLNFFGYCSIITDSMRENAYIF